MTDKFESWHMVCWTVPDTFAWETCKERSLAYIVLLDKYRHKRMNNCKKPRRWFFSDVLQISPTSLPRITVKYSTLRKTFSVRYIENLYTELIKYSENAFLPCVEPSRTSLSCIVWLKNIMRDFRGVGTPSSTPIHFYTLKLAVVDVARRRHFDRVEVIHHNMNIAYALVIRTQFFFSSTRHTF